MANASKGLGRKKGRPSHHLHADDHEGVTAYYVLFMLRLRKASSVHSVVWRRVFSRSTRLVLIEDFAASRLRSTPRECKACAAATRVPLKGERRSAPGAMMA